MQSPAEIAKKMMLLQRISAKRKQIDLLHALDVEGSFLDVETSVAVWQSLRSKAFPVLTNRHAVRHVCIGEDTQPALQLLETSLRLINAPSGFLFPETWLSSGALIVGSNCLSNNLNDKLLAMDDELTYADVSLSNYIVVKGDRSGGGALLNEITVAVTGGQWMKYFSEFPKKPCEIRVHKSL